MSLFKIFLIFLIIGNGTFSLAFANNLQEYYEQAAVAYQSGDYKKAIELYHKVLEIDSQFAPAYNALGEIYQNRSEDVLDAVWYFKEALKADPNYLEAYENLGKVYHQANEPDQAVEYLQKALAIDPDHFSSQFTLAWVYLLGKSQPQEAEKYFKKVIERKEIPVAYYGLGLAYSMSGNNAMVLDIVTQLRKMGQNEYAAQLEQAIRKPFHPQEAPLALPPAIPQKKSNVLVETYPKSVPPSSGEEGKVAGFTKIRLKGKLTGIEKEKKGGKTEKKLQPAPSGW